MNAAHSSPPIPFHPRVFRVGDWGARSGLGWSTGFPELDRALPDQGWPRAGMVDLACDAWGVGEVSLVVPGLVATLGAPEARGLWVLPAQETRHMPWIPYAPSLAASGLSLDRIALVRPQTIAEGLWCAEQALRSGAVVHVVLWLEPLRLASLSLKRLQQAAMCGGACLFAFRPTATLDQPSPAPLRLLLSAPAQGGLRIALVKRRGLPEGCTLLLSPHAMPCLGRSARPVAPEPGERRPWRPAMPLGTVLG